MGRSSRPAAHPDPRCEIRDPPTHSMDPSAWAVPAFGRDDNGNDQAWEDLSFALLSSRAEAE